MLDVVYYRLPDAEQYHVVRGHARTYSLQPDLDECAGFVMAPFMASADTPYVVVPPERTFVRRVPKRVKSFPLKWTEKSNKALYKESFYGMHKLLDNGALEKVVLSRRVDGKISQSEYNAERLFRKVCVKYPHQMIVLVNSSVTGMWLMSTPEVLLRREGERWATMALAGTKVGSRPWTMKDIREQSLVEKYIAEAIEPYAADVEQSEPYDTMAAALCHRRTDFSFRLREGASLSQLVENLHPTPAVCGIPKNLAIGSIRRFEGIDRRYYSGFCGPWNIDGDCALFVSLRCMEIDGGRDFHLYAGGGLLKESTIQSEWKETERKMDTMRNVLR